MTYFAVPQISFGKLTWSFILLYKGRRDPGDQTNLYYLTKDKIQQVIRTEKKWGPGDKEVRQQILEEMTHGQIPRVGAYAYENNSMAYEAYHM